MAGKRVGRPPSQSAASHDKIIDAVFDLLHEKSVRDLTIEEVARRAGVGKPTIYKWWSSKAALVLAMFDERIAVRLAVPPDGPAEQVIREQVRLLIEALNGFAGKAAAEIIAEGQSEPALLEEYRERYVRHRRAFTSAVVKRAQAAGEFRADVDPEVLIDMIYGPIYYRLLVRHQPLTEAFGMELVDRLVTYMRTTAPPQRASKSR